MNPAMYLFINEGLGMSAGKIAAQAAHAAVEAYRASAEQDNTDLLEAWQLAGHYKKLVMSARDTEHLLVIDRYLRDRGVETCLIIDEGMTEIPAHTPTALGVPVVDKDDPETAAIFSTFKVMKPPKPIIERPVRRHWWRPK